MNWLRVNKQRPCPACGHDSWCLVHEDGQAAICMRVQSGRPKQFKTGETGYIHKLTDQPQRTRPIKMEPPKPEIEADALMKEWSKKTRSEWLSDLAEDLGVKASSLLEMGVAWSHRYEAYAFPMSDGWGRVVGIRLRNTNGDKWSVRGSKSGIFLPHCHSDKTLWVVEGATDACAGLSIGLYTVGRPSCSGGLYEIKTLVERLQIKEVVIIADNDTPGLNGAESLVRNLVIPSCVITLPCKDLREYLKIGGTVEGLEELTKDKIWRNVS